MLPGTHTIVPAHQGFSLLVFYDDGPRDPDPYHVSDYPVIAWEIVQTQLPADDDPERAVTQVRPISPIGSVADLGSNCVRWAVRTPAGSVQSELEEYPDRKEWETACRGYALERRERPD